MPLRETIIEYCKRERESLKQQIELLENGTLQTGMREDGGSWVDTTAQSHADAKADLAEIERILAEAEAEEKK